MKLIEFIDGRISKDLKDKLINILAIVSTIIIYIYFIYLSILFLELIFLIKKGEYFKLKNTQESSVSAFFFMLFIIISPLSLANYFYNYSKFRNTKIGRIRFFLTTIGITILLGSFLIWLGRFKIINIDLHLLLDKYIYSTIYSALIFQFFLLIIIQMIKPNNVAWASYLSANLFWILALFFIISSMLYIENESAIFSRMNLIILIMLTFVAVTYSFIQQFLYEIIRKFIVRQT